MSDSANTFQTLLPDMKDIYSSKLEKLNDPTKSKKYFAHIKRYIKKAKKTQV